MPEEDKIGHLLKGIAEDVYSFFNWKRKPHICVRRHSELPNVWNAQDASDFAQVWSAG